MFTDVTATYANAAPDGSDITAVAHWPPVAGDTFDLWDWLIQAWREIAKREAVANGAYANGRVKWPKSNDWDSGPSIAAATDNGDGTVSFTMGLSAGQWNVDCFSSPPFRWVGYACTLEGGSPVCVPEDYKLVIDPAGALQDPSKVVQMFITAQTYTSGGTTGTLTGSIGPINDMITAGILTGLSELVGAPWCIIDANGVYASDRIPAKPLARQEWAGTGTIGTTAHYPTPTSTNYSVLIDTNAKWTVDQWASEDLLFYDVRLKRVSIAHNDATHLYFDLGTYDAVSTLYCIAPKDAVTYPGAPQHVMLQWCYGASESVFSHSITDSPALGPAVLALANVYLTVDGVDPCDHQEPFTAFDLPDAYIDFNNECYCLQVGEFFSPYAWKSIRSLQVELLSLCGAFVPQGYAGPMYPNTFTSAMLLDQIVPANSGTATAYVALGNLNFAISESYDGVQIYYTLFRNSDNFALLSGQATPVDGVLTIGSDPTPSLSGSNVVWSAGNTRWHKRRVKYFYGTPANWIPDGNGLGGYTDPPAPTLSGGIYSCTGVGTFIYRRPSTNYALFDTTGQLVDNAGPAFVDTDLVCHEGDNQGSSPIIPQTPFSGAPVPALMSYYDRMFRGTYDKPLRTQRRASMSGNIVGTTAYSITTDQHWWSDGVNPGLMRTDSGTASSGSATSLTDTTRNTALSTLPWGCWYGASRFATGFAPYCGGWWNLECDVVQTGTDLAIDAINAQQVTSGSYNFSSYDVGAQITISPGGAWVAGQYTIASVTPAGAAILSASPGPISTAAGAWSLTTTYKLPITSFIDHHGAGGVTFGFAAVPGFTVTAGMAWRIKETYCAGKWIGRDLVLKLGNGTILRLPILGNDDSTLFFAAQAGVIPLAAQWEIQEKSFGGTWQYSSAAGGGVGGFIVPPNPVTGILPEDQSETSYQKKIEPTYVKDYGPARNGDVPGAWIFDEIMPEILALSVLKAPVTWTANRVPGIPEVYSATDGNDPSFGFTTDGSGGAPFESTLSPFDGSQMTSTDQAAAAMVYGINNEFGYWDDPYDPTGWEAGTAYDGTVGLPQKTSTMTSAILFDGSGNVIGGVADLSEAISTSGYANVSGVCTLFASAATFYTVADQGITLPVSAPDAYYGEVDEIFDSMGDPVLYQGWKSFDSLPASTTASRVSDQFSNPLQIELVEEIKWESAPNANVIGDASVGSPSGSNKTTQGYAVTDACVLLDFSEAFNS